MQSVKNYYIEPLKSFKSWTILGNHDVYYKSTNAVNSVELLMSSATNLVTEPTHINFDTLNMLLIPWINNENRSKIFNSIKKSNANILGGHLELAGFEMHKGHIHSEGTNIKEFSKFDLVMSGHYHHKSEKSNVNYLGCPYEMDWADYNDTKGFHIFDTETRELIFIPNTSTMFYRINYDDSNEKINLENIDFSVFKNKIIKVVIKNKDDPYHFDKLISSFEKNLVYDLQIIEDHMNFDLSNLDEIIDEAEDTLTIFKKSIKQLTSNVDKKKLNKLAFELYQESMSIL